MTKVAEETTDPRRNILLGFGLAILTVVVLCVVAYQLRGGLLGDGRDVPARMDSPLPPALSRIVRDNDGARQGLIALDVFDLLGSFHGSMPAGGRAVFAFPRFGFALLTPGTTPHRDKTPVKAFLLTIGWGEPHLCLQADPARSIGRVISLSIPSVYLGLVFYLPLGSL